MKVSSDLFRIFKNQSRWRMDESDTTQFQSSWRWNNMSPKTKLWNCFLSRGLRRKIWIKWAAKSPMLPREKGGGYLPNTWTRNVLLRTGICWLWTRTPMTKFCRHLWVSQKRGKLEQPIYSSNRNLQYIYFPCFRHGSKQTTRKKESANTAYHQPPQIKCYKQKHAPLTAFAEGRV